MYGSGKKRCRDYTDQNFKKIVYRITDEATSSAAVLFDGWNCVVCVATQLFYFLE